MSKNDIHVIFQRWDFEALCGFPRLDMTYHPEGLRGRQATCAACIEQRRLLRGDVKYPADAAKEAA